MEGSERESREVETREERETRDRLSGGMRDVHGHNRVEEEKKNLQCTNCLDKSDFCIKEQTCLVSFPS